MTETDRRILVAYASWTGNTRRVAEAIFGEIEGRKEIRQMKEVTSLDGYDLAFLGFPIHAFGPDRRARRFLENRAKGRRIALFITHGLPEDVEPLLPMLARFSDAAAEAKVVGMFDCQGQLVWWVKAMMSMHPEYRSWMKMDTSQGQPDSSRLDRARVFARDVMESSYPTTRLR